MTLLLAKFDNKLININDYKIEMKGKIHCNCCDEILTAKKGETKIHHFAHKSKENCDEWYHKHKTEWHLLWQNICDDNFKEFVIKNNDVKHIADIYDKKNKTVIEIQHSSISYSDIKKRELFYGNMIWIMDLIDKCKVSVICQNCVIIHANKTNCFNMEKPVFFDTQYGILKLLTPLNTGYCVCEIMDTKIFLDMYFSYVLCDVVDDAVKKIKTNHKEKINDVQSLEINYKKIKDVIVFEGIDFNNKKLKGKYSLENNSGILDHLGFVCHPKEQRWKISNKLLRPNEKDMTDDKHDAIINDIYSCYDEHKLEKILSSQYKNDYKIKKL